MVGSEHPPGVRRAGDEWSLIWVGFAAVFCLVMLLAHRRRRRRDKRRRPRSAVQLLGRRVSSFNARAWPGALGQAPTDFQRPADIEGADPRILPPPRATRGQYGE